MAVFWAVCCMIFTAGNDLTFKFFARRKRSYGLFLAIIGVIWLITAFCFVREMPGDWRATILWGAISGVFSILGNILLLEGMRVLDAGACSTIYRLNLVPVVLGAALLLGESISLAGFAGIFCALLAVIGFMPRRQEGGGHQAVLAGIGITVVAALLRAGMGLSYRYGFMHGADSSWVVVINAVFWIGGGILYRISRENGTPAATDPAVRRRERNKLLGYGVLSGVLVAAIVITMAAGLACGNASVVLPIAQMSFILTGILGVILLKEKLGPRRIAAVLAGAAAILLLSL